VRVVDLFPERHDGSDVSDWIADDTAGVKFAKEVKEASPWEPSGPATTGEASSGAEPEAESADTMEIARLAKMKPLEYERGRKAAAEKATCVAILDRLVGRARASPAGTTHRHAGARHLFQI
jgi:hypothetical protein